MIMTATIAAISAALDPAFVLEALSLRMPERAV
jgi:hypothetical protein